MPRQFSKVQFQSPIFASNVNIGAFLPSANKTFKELSMTWTTEGMLINISDPNYRITACEIIVPWANVVWAQFLPEEEKPQQRNVDANRSK